MYKLNGTQELSSTHRQHRTLVHGNTFVSVSFHTFNTAGVATANPVTDGSHFVPFVYVHLPVTTTCLQLGDSLALLQTAPNNSLLWLRLAF